MDARREIADFLGSLITVYTIIIIAWVVVSLVLSLGVRIPYSRWSNALLDFLRDVTEPYLRIFRRFVPRIGPSYNAQTWSIWPRSRWQSARCHQLWTLKKLVSPSQYGCRATIQPIPSSARPCISITCATA